MTSTNPTHSRLVLTLCKFCEKRPPSDAEIQRQLDQATRYAREGFNAGSRYRPATAPQATKMKTWGGKGDAEDSSFEFQHSLLQKLDRVKTGLPEGQRRDVNKQQDEARSHASGSSSSAPTLPKGIPKQAPPPMPSSCLSQFVKVPEPRKPYAIPKKSQAPPTSVAPPKQTGGTAKDLASRLPKRLTFDSWREYEETLSPVVLDEVAAEMWQAKDEADPPVPAYAVRYILACMCDRDSACVCVNACVCVYVYIYTCMHRTIGMSHPCTCKHAQTRIYEVPYYFHPISCGMQELESTRNPSFRQSD
jgi:hypothetical protein